MDDMTAFERQLGTVLDRMGGPEPSFDAMAIASQAAATAPAGRWMVITRGLGLDRRSTSAEGGFSMFSALKIVTAAAVVALFGGFLLFGFLVTPSPDDSAPAAVSASPSPETTDALLSGLQTEEVEPGVLRVTGDGIHDLAAGIHRVAVGADGSVWVSRGRLVYQLGATSSDVTPDGGGRYRVFEVDGTGRPWSLGEAQDGTAGLVSLADHDWIIRKESTPDEAIEDVAMAPDGTVWAMWTDAAGQGTIASFDGTEWEPFEGGAPPIPLSEWDGWGELLIDPDGVPWVNSHVAGELASDDSGPLYGYIDGTWQSRSLVLWFGKVAVGPDGTRWLRYRKAAPADCGFNVMGPDCDYSPDSLAYYDGAKWHEMDEATGATMALGTSFEVAPDGGLWTGLRRSETNDCGGIGRFEPDRQDRYLDGHCTHDFGIASDGAVWTSDGSGLYVILPE